MNIEKTAKILTVFTFVLLCWVAHRALQPRVDCISSSYLSLILIDGEKIFNCAYESRLNLKSVYAAVSFKTLSKVRALENLEELRTLVPPKGPRVAIEVLTAPADHFEIGKGYARIGNDWLAKPVELRRSLIMTILQNEMPHAFSGHFELGVIADFLNLTLYSASSWTHSSARDLRFSTASKSQGFGPLLALGLAEVYWRSPLNNKVRAMQRLRSVDALPMVFEPLDTTGSSLAIWFEKSLRELAGSLGLNSEMALRQTLKVLEVEAPTHWELTVDVTRTPAWKEILEQLKRRSEFRPKERILVFTPEGSVALPSGLPVEWTADEISSQKHVMIACAWPRPEDAMKIQARHVFAEQSCEKLTKPFWD